MHFIRWCLSRISAPYRQLHRSQQRHRTDYIHGDIWKVPSDSYSPHSETRKENKEKIRDEFVAVLCRGFSQKLNSISLYLEVTFASRVDHAVVVYDFDYKKTGHVISVTSVADWLSDVDDQGRILKDHRRRLSYISAAFLISRDKEIVFNYVLFRYNCVYLLSIFVEWSIIRHNHARNMLVR